MAHLDAHCNPIVATLQQAPAPAQAAGQPFIDMNELKTAFSNPKADISIPFYYGYSTMDNVSAKFFLEKIRTACSTY